MPAVYMREKSPGRWQLRIYRGTDGKGKPLFRYETVRGDRAAAAARRAELEALLHRGALDHLTEDTLGGWVDAYLARREASGELAPSTLDGYRQWRRRLPEKWARMPLAKVRPRDLEAAYMDASQRLSRSSVRGLHRLIHVALEDAVRLEELPANPASRARPPAAAARAVSHDFEDAEEAEAGPIQVLKSTEVAALLESWREGGADRRRRPNPVMAALTLLAYKTGARRGELCALSWRALDLDAGVVHIRRSLYWPHGAERPAIKEPKTKGSRRSLRLDGETRNALRAWRRELAEIALRAGCPMPKPVFPDWHNLGPLRPYRVTIAHGTRAKALGLGATRFHDIRHTYASERLAERMPITEVARRLGHASPIITLGIYAHAIPDWGREDSDASDSIL